MSMAQVIIRKLDEAVVSALKARAAANGRSLEHELRLVLAAAATPSRRQVQSTCDAIRGLTRARVESDLEQLIREDRSR